MDIFTIDFWVLISYSFDKERKQFFQLRSFGYQGALYYVFLASNPLKTSREYAVFTLRTRGPKVCTRRKQRVSVFLF